MQEADFPGQGCSESRLIPYTEHVAGIHSAP